MHSHQNVYEPPKSNLESNPPNPSMIPGLLLYLSPTLIFGIILIGIRVFAANTLHTDYLWMFWLCCLISILVAIAMNRLAWNVSKLPSKTVYLSSAIFGGVVWGAILSLSLPISVYLIWWLIGFRGGPTPLLRNIIAATIKCILYGTPVLSLVFVPMHLLYSIHLRRVNTHV
jgi:hypothetical protein